MRRPPRSTLTDKLCPYTALFRSEGIAGGMPRLVHEVLRQDRVSNRGDAVRVAARGIDLDGYEAIAERFAQVLERSEEHTSELQSLMRISYAGFCLKKKKIKDLHITRLHIRM